MKQRVFYFLVIFSFFMPFSLAAGEAPGTTPPDEVAVPEITVTYTRGEQDPAKIPADVTVIEQQEIEKSDAASVPDLLRKKAGINVTNVTGIDKFGSVGLRGFTRGLDTVVMINGVALNMPTLGEVDWSIIPISAVERIEIVRGPGSVLWGDKAVAGVINIITKRAIDKPVLEIQVKGGSNNTLDNTLSVGYGNKLGRIFITGITDYTDGYRENNYYDHSALSLSGGLTPSDVLELTLDMGYAKDAWGYPGALFDKQKNVYGRRYSHTPDDSGTGENFYTLFGVNLDFSDYGKLQLDYSYKNNSNWSEYKTSTGYINNSRNYLEENDLSGKYILELTSDDIDNRLTLGVDYKDIGYRTSFFTPDWYSMGLLIPSDSDVDARRSSIAAYGYNELELFNRVVVSFGYRLESISTEFTSTEAVGGAFPSYSRISLAEDFSESAFNAGVTYLIGDTGKVFFRFERGYRIPALDEIFQYAPPTWTLANTHLPTERVTSYEVGIEHRPTDYLSYSATCWWANYDDELYYDNLTYVNSAYKRTIHRGIDLSVEVKPFDFLTCSLGYSWQDAYFDYPPYRGKSIPLVPKHTITCGVDFDYKGFSARLDGKYVSDRYRDGDLTNIYKPLDGYFMMNMRVGYTYKIFEAFAGINNLADVYSADFGGWRSADSRGFYFDYPNPGRTFYGGISVKF